MRTNRRVRFVATFAWIVLFASPPGFSQKKKESTYPEQGSVTQVRRPTLDEALGERIVTHGDGSQTRLVANGGPVYKIVGDTRVYEFQLRSAKDRLDIGSQIWFRIAKDYAYVQQGRKEGKFLVLSIGLKSAG